MNGTPRAMRPHIVLAGKCNAGKSSLINSLTERHVAIVSESAGTTTDPVFKSMELPSFGPVVFVDTAGLNDGGALGGMRIASASRTIASADLLLYVLNPRQTDEEDLRFIAEWNEKRRTGNGAEIVIAETFCDASGTGSDSDPGNRVSGPQVHHQVEKLGLPFYSVSNETGAGMKRLKDAIISRLRARAKREPTLLQDLVKQYQLIMLIVPIDLEAPAGRLILPQVQTIRQVLDSDAATIVVKEREVDWMLRRLKCLPDLAITDSQVVLKASGSIPESIPLTTFSILFSRLKGDLAMFVRNVRTIDDLQQRDRVLLTESCAHDAHCDDIARVKIPRWLRQYTGKDLEITVSSGEFPKDIGEYRLIIHCGGCMATRSVMQCRLQEAESFGVPVTNYGVAISYLQGVLDRVIAPFEEELKSVGCTGIPSTGRSPW